MTTDLTDRDRRIVSAVASGARQAAVADLARCSTRTVRRMLARPEVAAAVRAEREAQSQVIVDLLREQSRGAVHRLGRIIRDGADRDAVAAARTLLAEARQHREQAEVLDRLSAVEASLADRQENR